MQLEDLRELATPRGQRLDDEKRSSLTARLDETESGATELRSYRLDQQLNEDGIVVMARSVGAFRLGENEFVVVTRTFRHEAEREREARASYAKFAERWKSDTLPKAREAYGLDQELELMSFEEFWSGGRDDMRRGGCDRAWTGYSSRDEALQDVFRIALGLILDGPSSSVREAAGWERDMVLLVRGADYYTVTTRANKWGEDREMDVDRDERAFWATVSYARRLLELARREYDGIGSLAGGGNLRASWLAREGASLLLDQARHTTKMEIALYAMNGSMSELALKLHTDRANLYRLLPAGMKRRVR